MKAYTTFGDTTSTYLKLASPIKIYFLCFTIFNMYFSDKLTFPKYARIMIIIQMTSLSLQYTATYTKKLKHTYNQLYTTSTIRPS